MLPSSPVDLKFIVVHISFFLCVDLCKPLNSSAYHQRLMLFFYPVNFCQYISTKNSLCIAQTGHHTYPKSNTTQTPPHAEGRYCCFVLNSYYIRKIAMKKKLVKTFHSFSLQWQSLLVTKECNEAKIQKRSYQFSSSCHKGSTLPKDITLHTVTG